MNFNITHTHKQTTDTGAVTELVHANFLRIQCIQCVKFNRCCFNPHLLFCLKLVNSNTLNVKQQLNKKIGRNQ